MAGVKGRSGRYKAADSNAVNQAADLSFKTVLRILQDESIPILERGKYALPIVVRRVPDKQELISLSLNLSDESARQLIDLASRNMALRKELAQSQAVKGLVTGAAAPGQTGTAGDNRGAGVGSIENSAPAHTARKNEEDVSYYSEVSQEERRDQGEENTIELPPTSYNISETQVDAGGHRETEKNKDNGKTGD